MSSAVATIEATDVILRDGSTLRLRAPAAEDASMIPTNQYFLTLDADGTHVSSDFYLRLAGAATQMINASAGITTTVPIPPTV